MRRFPQPLARWDLEGPAWIPAGDGGLSRRRRSHTRSQEKGNADRHSGSCTTAGPHTSAGGTCPLRRIQRVTHPAVSAARSRTRIKSARSAHESVTRRIYGMNITSSTNLSDFTSRDRPARTPGLVMSAPPPRRPHTKPHPTERDRHPSPIPLLYASRRGRRRRGGSRRKLVWRKTLAYGPGGERVDTHRSEVVGGVGGDQSVPVEKPQSRACLVTRNGPRHASTPTAQAEGSSGQDGS
ncbi:hypothetical protein ACVWYT_008881 [Streptomyces sp. TE4109]